MVIMCCLLAIGYEYWTHHLIRKKKNKIMNTFMKSNSLDALNHIYFSRNKLFLECWNESKLLIWLRHDCYLGLRWHSFYWNSSCTKVWIKLFNFFKTMPLKHAICFVLRDGWVLFWPVTKHSSHFFYICYAPHIQIFVSCILQSTFAFYVSVCESNNHITNRCDDQ